MEILKLCHKSTNIYFIRIKDGWLMVDAGWPDSFFCFLTLLRRSDVDLHDIRFLIVTHFHPDHAGLVQDLKNAGITTIMLGNQVPYLHKLNEYMKFKPEMRFIKISMDNIRVISCGESRSLFKSLGFDGELIPTPGHSDDSITLIIDKDSAFTGDLPSIALAEAFHDRVIDDSWHRIGEYGVRYIYPAHGEKYLLKK